MDPARWLSLPWRRGLHLGGVTFEWDDRKAAASFKKHGVSFEDASSVFLDHLRSRSQTPTIR
jgi:hypothetical protein